MDLTYDPEADAAYLALSAPHIGRVVANPEIETSAGSVILDVDRDGRILGVEILSASRMLDPDVLASARRPYGGHTEP